MGICHVFDAVSDKLARRQAVKHAIMTHRDTIIHGDGVEFLGNPASGRGWWFGIGTAA